MPASEETRDRIAARVWVYASRGESAAVDAALDMWNYYRTHVTEWDAEAWGIRGLGQDLRMTMERRIALARNNAEVI